MSQFEAVIEKIDNHESLNVVSFRFYDLCLKMMSLELSSEIKVGTKVRLTAKPTAVAISKEKNLNISTSNQIPTTVVELNKGELLSSLILKINDSTIESIITTDAVNRLDIKLNDSACALIKASDLSILEVIDA